MWILWALISLPLWIAGLFLFLFGAVSLAYVVYESINDTADMDSVTFILIMSPIILCFSSGALYLAAKVAGI